MERKTMERARARLAHWRHYEGARLYRALVGRPLYRGRRLLKQLFGYGLHTGGTDCDGMRWESFSYHWTAKACVEDLEHQYEWADGPMGGLIVNGWELRAYEAEYVPDTRDRYAEAMGY